MNQQLDDSSMVPDNEVPQVLEDGPSLPALLSEDFVDRFERGVVQYKRWLSVCYKLTRPEHWINQGSATQPRYSLQGPGAEALMNPLGLNFERPTFKREDRPDDQGGFYIYWCEGYVESRALGRRGYYIGYCDSRDQFFNARPGWNQKIGEGDIKKSAYTNWIVNAVTRIAGIRSPDPDTLKAAGLDPARIPSIEYKQGFKEIALPEEAKGKLADIRVWLMVLCGNDKEKAKAKLKELTAFKDFAGVEDSNKLSERQLSILHPKIKKLMDAHTAPTAEERQPGEEG